MKCKMAKKPEMCYKVQLILEARSWVDYHLRGIMKPALKYIKLLSNILPMGPLQGISDTETAAEAATKYR